MRPEAPPFLCHVCRVDPRGHTQALGMFPECMCVCVCVLCVLCVSLFVSHEGELVLSLCLRIHVLYSLAFVIEA